MNPKPKKVNQEEFYEVEAIVGKRKLKAKKLEYKVKWVGYQESEATWQPAEKLFNCYDLIDSFEKNNTHVSPAVTRRKYNKKHQTEQSKGVLLSQNQYVFKRPAPTFRIIDMKNMRNLEDHEDQDQEGSLLKSIQITYENKGNLEFGLLDEISQSHPQEVIQYMADRFQAYL